MNEQHGISDDSNEKTTTNTPRWSKMDVSNKSTSVEKTPRKKNRRTKRDIEDYFENKRIRELLEDELDVEYKELRYGDLT